jgi:hypothetical protein
MKILRFLKYFLQNGKDSFGIMRGIICRDDFTDGFDFPPCYDCRLKNLGLNMKSG